MNIIPRPKNKRIIRNEPGIHYFNPQRTGIVDLDSEQLSYDELEAMRLKYMMGKTQEECAELMDISQSTFSRTLAQAITKVTTALVEGKTIELTEKKPQTKLFFLGYACRDCQLEWRIDIDNPDIPLEPSEEEIHQLLPLDDIKCVNSECESSNIYRLVRMME